MRCRLPAYLGTGGWVHSNVWAGSHLDATYISSGLYFHLADPLGTRRVTTSSQGAVLGSYQSLPFGDGLVITGIDPTEHHFTGKERDTESGNDYFGARYYASTMGRFMSPDPATNLSRVLAYPQRWNRYAYVLNNPLGRLDPDGAQDVEVTVWRDTKTKRSTTGRIDMRGGNGRSLSGKYLEPGLKGVDPIHPKGRISEGEYDATFHASLNGHPVPALFLLQDVPGFTGINIHNGNKPADTEGCLLYGTDLATDWVSGSGAFRTKAMDFLKDVADDDGTSVGDLTIHVSIPVGNIDTFTPPEPFGGGNPTSVGAPPPGTPGTGHWDDNFHWVPNENTDPKHEGIGWH